MPVNRHDAPVDEYFPEMDLRVLGPVTASIDGRPIRLGGRKQRTVLALLILDAARVVPFDVLIEGVWGEQATSGARSTLQSYVFNLRSVLGDRVVTESGGYRLAVETDDVDAVRFESAVDTAATLVAARPFEAADLLRNSLAMWTGSPYGDVAPSVPLQAEARRLEEVRLRALEDTVEAELALGRHAALLPELEVLTTEFPLSERFRAHQMVALYRAGRQSEALRAYDRARRHLIELGLDPWPRLRTLEQRILEHDPDLEIQVVPDVRALALLMTDIEKAGLLWESRPDETAQLMSRHHRIVDDAVHEAGGRVVRRSGDGVLATLTTVDQAVDAAHRVRALDGPDGPGVRMAIDAGEVELRGDEVAGPPLQRCSRLLSAGHGGQILLSDDAHAALAASNGTGWKVKALGEHRFDGLGRHLHVFQLLVDGVEDTFPPLRTDQPTPPATAWRRNVRGYELRQKVGGGRHGLVYRAYQPSVGREVAVKVIRPEHANQPDFVRRFEAEAHLVARLEHPHIVPLYDYWRDPDGAFLVTRWLHGGSLENALTGEPWDIERASRLLEQVGDALAYARRSGVAHGALKPGDILLDDDGNGYVAGFGIAAADNHPGTLGGHVPPDVDHGAQLPERSDVHGLGMIALELLTGTAPPPEPDRIPELARHLPAGAAIARACSPDPQARHASIEDFLAAVREARESEAGEAEVTDLAVRNPYKGLRAFQEPDAADFHGRADLVDEITTVVEAHRVVAVVGPSGIGKSSLVRAGLIPRLRSGAGAGLPWLVTDMIPGAYPLEELERALRRVAVRQPGELIEGVADSRYSLAQVARRVLPTGTRALLIIDQFEELFTLTTDDAARQHLIDALIALGGDHDSTLSVLVTLRSDHLDHPLRSPELGELLARATVMVAAPRRDDLVAAIVRPAAAVGVRFEPGLVERAVSEVGDEPGGLPLLQHALTELFSDRSGAVVTLADYERSGGVLGALGGRADAIYAGLDTAQQDAARQILLRLVTVNENAGDTRRRVTLRELRSLPVHGVSVDTVLGAFAAHRLLTFDRHPVTRAPTVEVAHEALLTRWDRLRDWIDDRREELLARRRLAEAVEEWERAGRDDGYLLTETRLARFETLAGGDLTVSGPEQAYLDASRDVADRRARVRRQARRWLVAGLATGLITTTALAGFALASRQRAADAATTARARELATASIAVVDADPTLSKLLAVASVDAAEPTAESVRALHSAWGADSVVDRYPGPSRDLGTLHTDLHPGGDLLLATGWADFMPGANYLEVYDLRRDQVMWTYETSHPSARPGRAIFSPDGSTVVAGVQWNAGDPAQPVPEALGAHILDTVTGELLDRIDLGRCGGIVDAMSATHLLVKTLRHEEAAATCDWFGEMAVELVDMRTGAARTVVADGINWSDGAVMSSDGRYAAFDDFGTQEFKVVDLAGDETLLSFSSQPPRYVRAMSPDGSLIAYGDNPIEIWDVHRGEMVASYAGHETTSFYVRFDPSGETAYSTGGDGSLHIWDATTGTTLTVVPHAGHLRPSATGDGRILVTRVDETAALVDTSPRGEVAALATCPGTVQRDTLRVAGRHAVVAVFCGDDVTATTHVLDLDSGRVLYTLPGHGGTALSVSPDGTRFARQEGDGIMNGPVTIRDLATGEVLVELEGMCTWDSTSPDPIGPRPQCREYPETPFRLLADRLRWSPDMTMIADTTVTTAVVWDTATGRLLYTEPHSPADYAFDVVFTLDSAELVISGGHSVRSVDTATWEAGRHVPNNSGGGYALGLIGFSPDGSTLLGEGSANGDPQGTLTWLDGDSLLGTAEVHPTHDASVASRAVSPDWRLVATGGSDGLVRVWDAATGALWQEISLDSGRAAAGVAFVNEHNLAVALDGGDVVVVTLDTDELVGIVRRSLTRGFTAGECERFGFGDNCPTLAELRGTSAGADSTALDGEYRIEWTTDELATILAAEVPDQYASADDARATWTVVGRDHRGPGTHTIRFARGRWDHTVTAGDAEWTCTGAYTETGGRLQLVPERGDCGLARLFSARFELDGSQLRFHDFDGRPLDRVLFATKPWHHVP